MNKKASKRPKSKPRRIAVKDLKRTAAALPVKTGVRAGAKGDASTTQEG